MCVFRLFCYEMRETEIIQKFFIQKKKKKKEVENPLASMKYRFSVENCITFNTNVEFSWWFVVKRIVCLCMAACYVILYAVCVSAMVIFHFIHFHFDQCVTFVILWTYFYLIYVFDMIFVPTKRKFNLKR